MLGRDQERGKKECGRGAGSHYQVRICDPDKAERLHVLRFRSFLGHNVEIDHSTEGPAKV